MNTEQERIAFEAWRKENYDYDDLTAFEIEFAFAAFQAGQAALQSQSNHDTTLFCDLKTDEEKSAFFLSGRGYETGVIAAAIQNDVAMAYHRCAEYKKELAALQSQPTNRWYAIDNTGLATLCADKQDAIDTASEAAQLYPKRAPYVVARMVPADADMQSQDREDVLVQGIQEAIALLGPKAPSCSGCEYEWNHALRVLRKAIDHARRIEGES